jgi:hypothetical protein
LAPLAGAVSSAHAIGVEFTPVVGHFTPLSSQITDTATPLVADQSDATTFGARVTAWVAPRIGVEASLLTAASTMTFIGGGDPLPFDATILFLDARARFRVNNPADAAGLDIIAGIGISNVNDVLSNYGEDLGFKSPSTFTYVLGIGGTVPITERVKLRFDVEDHIHDANYEVDGDMAFGGPITIDNTQHDIMVLAGIVIPIWD